MVFSGNTQGPKLRTKLANISAAKANDISLGACNVLPVWPKDTREIIARITPPSPPTVIKCQIWLLGISGIK
ncbi:MAG: hypothetical protein ACJA2G_000377 [Cognaticolwellia sp.]|jgi:hypothetical protein